MQEDHRVAKSEADLYYVFCIFDALVSLCRQILDGWNLEGFNSLFQSNKKKNKKNTSLIQLMLACNKKYFDFISAVASLSAINTSLHTTFLALNYIGWFIFSNFNSSTELAIITFVPRAIKSRTCGVHAGMRTDDKFWPEKPQGTDHLSDLGVDQKKILEWTLGYTCEDVEWIPMVRDWAQWRASLIMEMDRRECADKLNTH